VDFGPVLGPDAVVGFCRGWNTENISGLENGHHNVQQPQGAEEGGRESSSSWGSSKLSSDPEVSSDEQENDASDGTNAEHNDTESKGASWHVVQALRVISLSFVFNYFAI
jgi:hypothetical protein